jgi:RNA polymerase sigma-70 factor, ECF subfamily
VIIATRFEGNIFGEIFQRTTASFANGTFDAEGHVKSRGERELTSIQFSAQQNGQIVADDLALVAAVLRKDRKATAEFVDAYTDVVYAFVRRRLSPRLDLVDDLVQEVFIAAWENLTSFRGVSPLRVWLIGIARHKVEDYYRGLLQSKHLLEPGASEELAATDFDLDTNADRLRTEQRARQVLEELPEHYGVALKWRYWERRTARQMAEATGRSEKAIERLLARAREQFRRRWLA